MSVSGNRETGLLPATTTLLLLDEGW